MSVAMLMAKELEIELSAVKIEHAIGDDVLYASPLLGEQITGGSLSLRGAWKPMRQAGAAARMMLVEAAARGWSVPMSSCHAAAGHVLHPASGPRVGYRPLVQVASTVPVPQDPPLKTGTLRLIGKTLPRIDSSAKVNGSAIFGIDVRLPGMRYASVMACPVLGVMARASMREVESSEFKLHRAVALSGIPPIFMWRGDWAEALIYIKRLEDAAEQSTLRPYAALATAFRGQVAIATGDPDGGAAMIQSAMRGLEDAHYRLFSAPLMISEAQGLLDCGHAGRARDVIECCEELAIDSGSALHLPEIFRVKADILLASEAGSANPEALLDRAIAVARDVSARGWELRSATRLARLLSRSKRYDEAEATLRAVYEAFDECQGTVDIETARQELHALRARRARASDRDWRALS